MKPEPRQFDYCLTPLWTTSIFLPVALGLVYWLSREEIGIKPFAIIAGVVAAGAPFKNTLMICRVRIDEDQVYIDYLSPIRRNRVIRHADVSGYHSLCFKTPKRGLAPINMTLRLREGSTIMILGGMRNPGQLDELFMQLYPNANREIRTPSEFAGAVARDFGQSFKPSNRP